MESVRAQDLSCRAAPVELEYLVVDGGSTKDETVQIIQAFEKSLGDAAPGLSFKWLSEPDQGMYDALNKGVALSTGDVIGILNADDRLEDPHVIFEIAEQFGSDAALDAVYGDIRFVRGASHETTRYYSSAPWRPWMHSWGYMPAHPSVYVRREVFDRFGGYKLGYDISADFEWMIRVFCMARIQAKYLPRCMVTMRLGGKSTGGLKKMYRLNVENVRANRENGFFCCLPMMLPKYLFKIWGYVFRRKK